jgi:hypothetical protein
MSAALEVLVLAALKEVRCFVSRGGQQSAEGDFVLYDRVGEGVPVTLPLNALLGTGADPQELRRSKVTIRFEALGEREEMSWDAPKKLSAQELMEELAKACSPLSAGHAVSVIVQGPGLITLSARSMTLHRHVPLALDVDTLTREQLGEMMMDARSLLARAMTPVGS